MPKPERLAEASDPTTSEVRLDALSKVSSTEIQRAVAQNLSSPKSALARLFPKFPDEVLSNPATDLFNMETPGEPLLWIPKQKLQAVFEKDDLSEAVLRRLSGLSVNILTLLINYPRTPVDILEELEKARNPVLNLALSKNPRTPAYALVSIATYSSTWVQVLINLAENPSYPPAKFDLLLATSSLPVAQVLVVHPKASASLLDRIARMRPPSYSETAQQEMMSKVALHPNTSTKVLTMLAASPYWNVRMRVADHPHTDPEVLRRLASDESEYVLHRLVANPKTPTDVIEKLVDSSDTRTSQFAKEVLWRRANKV